MPAAATAQISLTVQVLQMNITRVWISFCNWYRQWRQILLWPRQAMKNCWQRLLRIIWARIRTSHLWFWTVTSIVLLPAVTMRRIVLKEAITMWLFPMRMARPAFRAQLQANFWTRMHGRRSFRRPAISILYIQLSIIPWHSRIHFTRQSCHSRKWVNILVLQDLLAS